MNMNSLLEYFLSIVLFFMLKIVFLQCNRGDVTMGTHKYLTSEQLLHFFVILSSSRLSGLDNRRLTDCSAAFYFLFFNQRSVVQDPESSERIRGRVNAMPIKIKATILRL